MSFAMSKKPFGWSPSAVKDFEVCPKRYYHTRIAKDFREAESEQLIWGNRFHEAIAASLDPARNAPLPDELLQFAPWVNSARNSVKVIVEQQMAMSRDMRVAPWFEDRRNPHAPKPWLRVIVDLGIFLPNNTVAVIDWKTGKPENTDDLQLDLSALMVMVHYPEVQAVNTAFCFIKHDNRLVGKSITRDDIPKVWMDMIPRVQKMKDAYDTTNYPPTPNAFCGRWCPVASCEHYGKRSGR